MNANVLAAIQATWDFAATHNNRNVLTPWMYTQCPERWDVYELGASYPSFTLEIVERTHDGGRVYQGTIHSVFQGSRSNPETFRISEPENFFTQVTQHLKRSNFYLQLSVAEYVEYLQFLRRILPLELGEYNASRVNRMFASRPFVGRKLASLTSAEASTLADHQVLCGLDNVGGRWTSFLTGGTFSEVSASVEGRSNLVVGGFEVRNL